MLAGTDPKSRNDLGYRKKVDIDELLSNAVQSVRCAFAEMGWSEEAVSPKLWEELKIQRVELVALRLYTGPMFVYYNGALRAMASGGVVPPWGGAFAGMDVKGKFVTTIHAINSGLIKLSRLQPCCTIYRGMHGMKLPKPFLTPNAHNVRGGVEYGFSSTTLDREVAYTYSRGAVDGASMIFEMRQGMINRGAFIGWLSQYPKEKEILLPPLLALELIPLKDSKQNDANPNSSNRDTISAKSTSTTGQEDEGNGHGNTFDWIREEKDGTLVCTMDLNINMQSMTIEEVLALRKKQCLEMAEVVQRDLVTHSHTGDVPRRLKAVRDKLEDMKKKDDTDVNAYNDNARFVGVSEGLLAQLPRIGDEVEVLDIHAKTEAAALAGHPLPSVTAMASVTSSLDNESPLLISGRSDGALVMYGGLVGPRTEKFRHESDGSAMDAVPIPILCVEVLSPFSAVAAGLFDHRVALIRLDTTTDTERQYTYLCAPDDPSADPVTALAWSRGPLWLASGSMAGEVVVWELDATQLREGGVWAEAKRGQCMLKGHADTVHSLEWLPQNVLASGALDGTVRLWRLAKDAISGQLTGECCLVKQHSGAVTGLAMSTRPNSQMDVAGDAVLVSVSADQSMCVWDPENFDKPVVERLRCHNLGICAVSAMANHQVATASADTTVKIWQLMLGSIKPEPRLTLRGHTDAVHSLCYIHSKGWLASGGKDQTIRLWRADHVDHRGTKTRSFGDSDASVSVAPLHHQGQEQEPDSKRQSTRTPLRTQGTPRKEREPRLRQPPPLPRTTRTRSQIKSPKRPARAPVVAQQSNP